MRSCMDATSPLDLRLLRALREPRHGYELAAVLARDGGPDRATVYRRLAALSRAGLVARAVERGRGPVRQVVRLTPAGEAVLRDELRAALRLLCEAHDAHWRATRRGARGPSNLEGPLVFVSASRMSGVELRILATMAGWMPRRVHLVLPPGMALPGEAPAGVAVVEAPWAALPFRDGYAGTLMVNELPPARGFPRAVREWRRVLAPHGTLSVIASAPLPRGLDRFVDFLADLHDELYPDQAGAPPPDEVTRVLRDAFGGVEDFPEANQRVWVASPRGPAPRGAGRGGPPGTPAAPATSRGRPRPRSRPGR